jgi:DNA-binding HxlR family transcriptional regulator
VLHRTYPEQVCSIARSLEIVGERWTLLILRDARFGLRRFDEFQASLGIATNVLASRLKLLCDEGVLERRSDPERPGRPQYVLTEKGRALAPALITLMKWGDEYYPTAAGPPRLTLHSACGGRVDASQHCDRCHEYVDFGDLEVVPGPGLAHA